MKRSVFVAAMLGASMLVGCSGKGVTSPSATTESAMVVPVGAMSARSFAPKVVASPGLNFSDQFLGVVTVTNNDSAAHRFAYYVWDASDEVNQQLKDRQQATIQPGQSFTFQLNFAQVCGAKYQRDVYKDIQNYEGATTLSDVNNYFFGASGSFWQSEVGTCDTSTVPPTIVVIPPPPPPPPVDSCETTGRPAQTGPGIDPQPCHGNDPPVGHQDNNGNNDNGGTTPGTPNNPPPPPVVDVCPNIAGVQVTVPVGYHLQGNSCQPDGGHGRG